MTEPKPLTTDDPHYRRFEILVAIWIVIACLAIQTLLPLALMYGDLTLLAGVTSATPRP